MFDNIKNAFEGLWTSFIRTVIPIAVSAAVGFLARLGINVQDDFANALSTLLGLLAGALFYLIVRIAEKYIPRVGVLLGSAKQPIYATPAVQPEAEAIVATLEKSSE